MRGDVLLRVGGTGCLTACAALLVPTTALAQSTTLASSAASGNAAENIPIVADGAPNAKEVAADLTILALPELMPEAEEIALARSAAPVELGPDATVLVLRRGGYEVAANGTNGYTCLVSRSRIVSREPICYDREGSRTIVPMRLRRTELIEQGLTRTEAEAQVAEELAAGKFEQPARPALAFMLSSGQVLYNEEGGRAGAFRPHMHVFSPDLTAEAVGFSGPVAGSVMVFEDDALPGIVVLLPEFNDPEATD